MNGHEVQVVNSLSVLIAEELAAFSSEYWAPKFSSDQSDAELKFRKTRILRLKEMRDEFEELMFGLERDDL